MRPSTSGQWPMRDGPSRLRHICGFSRSPPPGFASTASWPPSRLAPPAPLRRPNARELNLARDGSLHGMIPWLAGTPSHHSLAPSSVPGRDTRCSPFRLDRQGLLTSPIAGEADQHGPRRGIANQVLRQQWPGQLGVRRRAAHNGLELSCPAEAGQLSLLYGTPAGQASSN